MGGKDCSCKKPAQDCSCNKKENVIINFSDLSIAQVQILRKNKPAWEMVKYFAGLDPAAVNVNVTPTKMTESGEDGYTVESISFTGVLTEAQVDSIPTMIHLGSSIPSLESIRFDIEYNENGTRKRLPTWVTQIIVTVIEKIFVYEVKKELKLNNGDGVITKPLIELLGSSVSRIVDKIISIIGSASNVDATYGVVKSYTGVTMSAVHPTIFPCQADSTCLVGFKCVNGRCVKS